MKQAFESKKPDPGHIRHSDRGFKYTSAEYYMVVIISRKRNCYDNACIVLFHSTLKRELIYTVLAYEQRLRSRKGTTAIECTVRWAILATQKRACLDMNIVSNSFINNESN